MTRMTCPGCRLRFAAAMAATLPSCPFCGAPLALRTAEQSLGYRLLDADAAGPDLPVARAAAVTVPPPATGPRA